MSAERLREVERHFDELVELEAEARRERLARLEASEPELAARVRALLRHDEEASETFLQPAGAIGGAVTEDLLDDGGVQLGPYRIRELLSEGGMGRIYLAEQQEPLVRRVAIKVLASAGLGEEVLDRFRLEQGALAALNHPNVAAVFDAGLTPGGAPWFAMEFVDGLPITRFAAERGLDLDERLELFLQLCEALQHAHESGLVHRDIKPANVLVTDRSGAATVKLIDFGIAKATHAAAADRTLTQAGFLLGTPEYMSPEQCGGAGAVGVRSDVYSLGLLLHELLTGARAFDWERLREGGLEAVLEAIRHHEPEPPSVRALSAPELSPGERAARARALRGDLDWIVGQAIDKEPARRYASVSELAADLHRHRSDQPVLAGPPSLAYRARKLLRRRALPLAAAGTVVAALAVGGGLAAREALEAREQRLLTAQAERLGRWHRHASSLAVAEESLAAGDPAGARRSLERSPPELRGWAWRQLAASLDDSVQALEPHGDVVSDLDVGREVVVTSSYDGELRIWRPAEGYVFSARTFPEALPVRAALSEPRGLVAVQLHDGGLSLLRADGTAAPERLASDLESFTGPLVIEPAGLLVAGTPDGRLRRWSLDEGRELEALVLGEAGLTVLALLPDGRRIVAGTDDGQVLLRDLAAGENSATRRLGDERILCLTVHPDGEEIVAVTEGGELVFLAAEDLALRRTIVAAGGAVDAAWAEQGRVLLTGSTDGRVRRWSADGARLLGTFVGHERGALRVAELPGGGRLIAASASGELRIFDPARPPARNRIPMIGLQGSGASLAPGGRTLVQAADDGSLTLTDLAEGRLDRRSAPSALEVSHVAIAPDGGPLLGATADGRVAWWDRARLTREGLVRLDETPVVAVGLARDGEAVVVVNDSGRVSALRLPDGELRVLGELGSCLPQSGAVAVLADAAAVGCVLDPRVVLFPLDGGPPRELEAAGRVFSLGLLRDGTELAAGLTDGSVQVLDVATGERRRAFVGHVDAVTAILELGDGERLATCSRDGTVRIWSRELDVSLTTLRPGLGALDALAWQDGDEEVLVVKGRDGLMSYAAPR